MIEELINKLECILNSDQELSRRLKGFKNFAGTPDGHYRRAREEGTKAQVRAVRCYPFGGKSLLDGLDVIGIKLTGSDADLNFLISLKDRKFSVKKGSGAETCLFLEIPKEIFKKTLIGRYRWLWVIGMDEVKVKYTDKLPHSDWVTIFEILVVMQEMAEFDIQIREQIEKL